jgi:hypothetical protein
MSGNKLLIVLTAILFGSLETFAQGKITLRVDVAYFQEGEELPYVTVRIRQKIDKKFEPIENLEVQVYFNEESEEAVIGHIKTNNKGEGKVVLPEALKKIWNDLDQFEIIAIVRESETIEETTESIFIKRCRLVLEPTETEDERLVKVVIEEKADDAWMPVSDAEVKVFIKRHFGRLTVGDDFYMTDEEGTVETDFKDEIPGDENGVIFIGAMIEDNDEYGNVITYKAVTWGTPLIVAKENGRALWATRDKAPWWLLVFPNLIIAGVWGVIIYLIVQVYKIKKLGKS